MTTASLELCKELYELSGWVDTEICHHEYEDGNTLPITHNPAYDLGYLLRKLPSGVFLAKGKRYRIWNDDTNNYTWAGSEKLDPIDADTPEDAACKLAIELFKEGVLK